MVSGSRMGTAARLLAGLLLLAAAPETVRAEGEGALPAQPPIVNFAGPEACAGDAGRLELFVQDADGVDPAAVTVSVNGSDVRSAFLPPTGLVTAHGLDFADTQAFSFPDLPGGPGFVFAGPLSFQELAGGARLRARLFSSADPTRSWELDLRFVNSSGTARRELPADAYLPQGPIDPTTWRFYALDPAASTCAGREALAGQSVSLSETAGGGLQVGLGANGVTRALGLSLLLDHAGAADGSGSIRLDLKPGLVLSAALGDLPGGTIQDGANAIVIGATDAAGDTNSLSEDFLADRSPPDLQPVPGDGPLAVVAWRASAAAATHASLPGGVAVSLPGLPGGPDFDFVGEAQLLEYAGAGRALLTGTLAGQQDPSQTWRLEMWLAAVPPANPLLELDAGHYAPGGPIDPTSWRYYAIDDQPATLRGLGSLSGQTVTLADGTTTVPRYFQLGLGANGRNLFAGLSGALAASGAFGATQGQLNLSLAPALPALVSVEQRVHPDEGLGCPLANGSFVARVDGQDVSGAFAAENAWTLRGLLELSPGAHVLVFEMRDDAGNLGQVSVQRDVQVSPGDGDADPPQLTAPADILVDQSGPTGSLVSFPLPTASDALDPHPAVVCSPAPGSLFPPGTTVVTCTATDAAGNQSNASFTVTVADTTAPSLTQSGDLSVEQSGPSGVVVNYAAPAASDAVDPNPTVACSPASGTLFPPGATVVTCTATDAAGNQSSVSFTVTVADTTAPGVDPPADLNVEQTGLAGSLVSYALPTVSDAVDPNPTMTCSPASGTLFPPGTTVVTCTATDAAGNRSSVSFMVTVADTTAPSLGQPGDLSVEQSGLAGSLVSYALPTASDAVDPSPSVVCIPAPGSLFPPGATAVTCTATDAAGNQSSVSFTVTVADTTAPTLGGLPDLQVEQTDPGGALVSFLPPAVGDAVDPNPLVTCAPPSGSTFPPGATSVVCTASDAAGNAAHTRFVVTVRDTVPPSLAASPDLTAEQTNPAGAAVIFALPGASDAADPDPQVTCSPPSGSTFPAGTTLVTCTATDAAGNQSTAGFTVTVADTVAPSLSLDPLPGTRFDQSPVLVTAAYADAGAGIDPGSLSATLDGTDVSSAFSAAAGSASASFDLGGGTYQLSLSIRDAAGNQSSAQTRFEIAGNQVSSLELSFPGIDPANVPLGAPLDLQLRALNAAGRPASEYTGFALITTSDGHPPLDGLLLEFRTADAGLLLVPGVAVFGTPGSVVVSATLSDPPPLDLSTTLSLNVVLTAPVIEPPPPAVLPPSGALRLLGTSFPGEPLTVLLNGAPFASGQAGPDGAFALDLDLPPGTHQVAVEAAPAGGTAARSTAYPVSVPLPTVTGIVLDPAQLTLATGEGSALTVDLAFSDGSSSSDIALVTLVSSDPAVASVDAAGFVQGLSVGSATLSATAGGVTASTAVSVGVPSLLSSSPADGEDGVAVTRETILRFSSPLDPGSVNAAAISADFAGQALAGRLHLAPTQDRVTLFYDDPLPPSARVRVRVDGDLLRSAAGSPIDADGDGAAGGTALIDFDTLSLTLVPGTAVCGRVFASELVPSSAGTSVNMPLEGVRITVDGAEDSLFTVTDALGDFRLSPAPAGRFFVHIDGRTATANLPAGAYYPFVGKTWESEPGLETNVGNVHLPLIQDDVLQAVSQTQDTTLTWSGSVLAEYPELAGVQVTVAAGSLFNDDGTPGGQVGIAPVPPDRLPGELPPQLNFSIVFTLQTDGATNFDTPVAVTFPNVDNLPPGSAASLWSFDHDTGRWGITASMTVSADGLFLVTDPGQGIVAPGWHAPARPGSPSGPAPVDDEPDPAPPEEPECEDPNHSPPCQECPDGEQRNADGDCVCKEPGTVILTTGEERFTRTDLVIPGRGQLSFVLERTYRSQISYDGPLGHGWDYSFNDTVFVEPDGDVIRTNGAGRMDRFSLLADGSYSPQAGIYSVLTRRPDGAYELRRPDGHRTLYRADGRLQAYIDRFDNVMLFDYDARGNIDLVIDPYGREIELTFAPRGTRDRLVRVRDFAGREVLYDYDAEGHLIAVRTPVVVGTSTGNDFPQGRTERYDYYTNLSDPRLRHNIRSVTAPEEAALGGAPRHLWVYGTDPADPLTYDKVVSETIGGTNATGIAAGGTRTFEYLDLATILADTSGRFSGLPAEVVGGALVTERDGAVKAYFVNALAHHIVTRRYTRSGLGLAPLRPGEPSFYQTRSTFDADGQLVERTYPEGNRVQYRYDRSGPRAAVRNMIERRRSAGPRGGGADLVTTFAYEPLYNQIAAITDPRGNDPGYVPPLSDPADSRSQAERYTTRYLYDYQEGSAPVPQAVALGIDLSGLRGLGDLNDDVRTDQVFGNLVRIERPSVLLEAGSNQALLAAARGDPTPTIQEVVERVQWNDRGQLTAKIDPTGNVVDYLYHPENDPDGDGRPILSPYLPPSGGPTGYRAARIRDARVSPFRTTTVPPAARTTSYAYDPVGNLTLLRDPRGVETHYEVNQLNETVAITRGAEVAEATARGQLLTGEGPLRYQRRFHFDHNGRVVRSEVEDRDGTTPGVGAWVERTFAYDILGSVVESSVEVDAGTTLVTRYRYNRRQQRTHLVRPAGNVRATAYDERHLPYQVIRGAALPADLGGGLPSPDVSTTQIDYDLNGNRLRLIDAADTDGDGSREQTEFDYDGFDRVVASTDALGNRNEIDYDPASKPVRARAFGHPPGTPAAPNVLLGDVRWSRDELQRTYRSDRALFLAGGFSPVRPVDLRDGDGDGFVTTRTEFDALSRRTFAVEDDLQTIRYDYDGSSRLVQLTDALGNQLRHRYDQNSNPIEVTSLERSPDGLLPDESFVTRYTWDQLDRLVRVSDNAGQTTRMSWDSRDNLIASSDPEGVPAADPLGLFPGLINGPGNTKRYVYDGLDRLVRQVCDLRVGGRGDGALDPSNPENPDGQITLSMEYDANSRLAARVDDEGNRTSFAWDDLDRRTGHTFADGSAYVFEYDRDDNLSQVTDPNGTIITKTYDALDRLVQLDVTRAAGVLGTTRETFAYDGLSRLIRSSDDNGGGAGEVCERVYDSLSRVLEERQNGVPVSTVFSGDGKRVACTYPGLRRIGSTHDALDRVSSRSDIDAAGAILGTVFSSRWVGPGTRELDRLHANGTRLAREYDAVKRPTRLQALAPGGASALVDRSYAYNRADVIVSEQRHDDDGLTDAYLHDSAYRVTTTLLDQGSGPGALRRDLRQLDYLLDGAGNRRSRSSTDDAGGVTVEDYAVNALNEYTAIAGTGRSHSLNGNLRDDGARTYVYDYKNRLVGVSRSSDGVPIATYRYLADNRRSRKTVFSQANPGLVSDETLFFYDGWRVCEEQDAAGNTQATYVYGAGYLDEVVEMERGGQRWVLHQNARHDVVAVSDAGGAVVERRYYDDFGRASDANKQPVASSAVGNPYGFQGRRLDAETGLYYFRQRYYDAETGRFLQRDPVWDAGNVGNQYSFVGNGPLGGLDPMGTLKPSGSNPGGQAAARAVAQRAIAQAAASSAGAGAGAGATGAGLGALAAGAAAVAAAGLAGYAIGTAIYDAFGNDIQDGLDWLLKPDPKYEPKPEPKPEPEPDPDPDPEPPPEPDPDRHPDHPDEKEEPTPPAPEPGPEPSPDPEPSPEPDPDPTPDPEPDPSGEPDVPEDEPLPLPDVEEIPDFDEEIEIDNPWRNPYDQPPPLEPPKKDWRVVPTERNPRLPPGQGEYEVQTRDPKTKEWNPR